AYCAATSSAVRSWMRRSTVAGDRPSGASGTSKSCAWRTVAARISKNSSRLVQEMHRKRRRSSSGIVASSAWARTRKLKSSCDSSRLRYSAGSRSGSSAGAAVVTGEAGAAFARGARRSGARVDGVRVLRVLMGILAARNDAARAEATGEGAAATDLAGDVQPGLVQLQDVLDDGQAQAGAAGLAGAAAGDAIEAFGQPREVGCGDAVAAVLDRQRHPAGLAGREADRDAPAAGGVAHRIGHQVGECAVQLAARAQQVDAGEVLDHDR